MALLACYSGFLSGVKLVNTLISQAGLDSPGAVDLRNAVAAEFGVDLPATAAFDYPTVSALAAYVTQEAAPPEAEAAAAAASTGPGGYQQWAGAEQDGRAAGLEAGSGGSMSQEQVLAGVRAAVAEALGQSVGDDEPLMEVSFLNSLQVRVFASSCVFASWGSDFHHHHTSVCWMGMSTTLVSCLLETIAVNLAFCHVRG